MFRWDLVWHFLFGDPNFLFLNAAWRTLWISVVAQAAGVFLGLFLALMRMSRFPLLTFPGRAYIWFFRGSPLLVQVLLFFFQAEDGIRDLTVTGVQTCALPISTSFTCVGVWAGDHGSLVECPTLGTPAT